MKIKITFQLLFILCFSCLQLISTAKADEHCEGFGIETESSLEPAGVKITKLIPDCAAHNFGLLEGDIIVSVNDDVPDAESLSSLLATMIPQYAYTLKIINVNGERVMTNAPSAKQIKDSVSLSDVLDVAEPVVIQPDEISVLPANKIFDNVISEDPIYAETDKVGYNGLKWIKWLIFFIVLSLTLTPYLIIFASNQKNVGVYIAGSAILGAANADRNPIKGAIENVRFALMIYFILLLLGPLGTLYCIYRPIYAFTSDADRTYCCAMTWLGGTNIAKKAISPDGRWLAEIKETQNNFLGLGDKEFEETNALSVMDLATGQHVKWPQSGQILIGVNTDYGQINKIKINDGIYIQPVDYLSQEETWNKIEFADEITKPLNFERILPNHVQFVMLSTETRYKQVNLQNNNSGEIISIQSSLDFNAHYLSYDGRVLALVKAYPKDKKTDGLIRQLVSFFSNFLFESWTIEFWDVAHNKKIANYSGHGINSEAWNIDDGTLKYIGQTKFLESSENGMLWYMIKSDGFIHVFDMNKYIKLL